MDEEDQKNGKLPEAKGVEAMSSGFLHELRRRRVLGSTVAYIIAAWLLVQVADVVLPAFEASPEILQYLIVGLAVLFPFALILSWFFDLTFRGFVVTGKETDDTLTGQIQDIPVPNSIVDEIELTDEKVEKVLHNVGAEKRIVTVLQCSIGPGLDLDGDPQLEVFRNALPPITEEILAITDRYEGFASTTGGEILNIYFGAETVHEDDTMRAFFTARDIINHIELLNTQGYSDEKFEIVANIGIHCASAIVEEIADKSPDEWLTNIGHTMKVVALLQISAAENEIIFSESVYQILKTSIECEPVAGINLPGSSSKSSAYKASEDFLNKNLPALTSIARPIFGREKELNILEECWSSTLNSQGQVALLRGEAGIGKSRLITAISEQVSRYPENNLITLQCSPYHIQSSLSPFLNYLTSLLNFDSVSSVEEKREVLREFLEARAGELVDSQAVFEKFLSLDTQSAGSSSPEKEKARLLNALLHLLMTQNDEESTLMVLEDLHWADQTSLELIHLLVSEVSAENVMIIATFRPTFSTDLTNNAHVNLINVNRLGEERSLDLVQEIDSENKIAHELRQDIVERSDGVPLYIEEFARSILDSIDTGEAGDDLSIIIPNSLQESLAARLHRLGRAKATLEIGATIGREFSEPLLIACSEDSEDEILEDINQLIERGLVLKKGRGNSAKYVITHALIQEAAHDSMLKSRRELCHERVASSLVDQFPAIAEQQPEILAQHFSLSSPTQENLGKAISYFALAARIASSHSANAEANNLLDNALALVDGLPPSNEKNVFKLQLRTSKVPVLIALQGYASEEMEETSRRALSLCESVNDIALQYISLYSVCVYYMVSGQHQTAFDSALKLENLLEGQDDGMKLEIFMILGLVHFFKGDLLNAESYLLRSIGLFEREKHGDHAFIYGQDPEVTSLTYLRWTYFALGEHDKGEEIAKRLKSLAETVNHPISISFCYVHGAWGMLNMGETEKIQQNIDKGIEVTSEFLLTNFFHQAQIIDSLYRYHLSKELPDIDYIEEAFNGFRADGARCFLVFWETRYAEICIDAGLVDKAKEILERIESELLETGEAWGESELIRMKAKLAIATGEQDKAVILLNKAIDNAESRNANGFALLSRCDLARYYADSEPATADSIFKEGLAGVSGPLPKTALQLASDLGQ